MFEKTEDEVTLKSLRVTDAHYPTDSTWGYTESRQKKNTNYLGNSKREYERRKCRIQN